MRILLCIALGLVVSASGSSRRHRQESSHYDVVVYGATPAGITAAVAASRTLRQSRAAAAAAALGVRGSTASAAQVLLVEPSKWIGGMVAGGLGCTDKVGEGSYGGLAKEFVNRTNARYLPADGGVRPLLPHCTTHTAFEPHVATEVFHEMLVEAGVDVMLGSPVVRVLRNGSSLTSMVLGSGSSTEVTGTVFVDST
eukprot:COSAG01_NODE_20936_length_926_cov_11.854897_1_plen_196_part_01